MVIDSTFLEPKFLTYFKRILTSINTYMLTNINTKFTDPVFMSKKQWKWDLKEIDKMY